MAKRTLGANRMTKKSTRRTVKVRFPNGQFRGGTVIGPGTGSGVKLRMVNGDILDNVAVATTERGAGSASKYHTTQVG
jgi:hypothetical protein